MIMEDDLIWGGGQYTDHVSQKCALEIYMSLAGVAQGTECWPVYRKFAGSLPSQGTGLDCSPGPQLGVCERQLIAVSLPILLPPFPSL